MHCSYCGSSLHDPAYCPKTAKGQENRNQLRCQYCGGRDHNAAACYKKAPGSNPVRIFDLKR